MTIKVLIVDDSAIVRKVLSEELERSSDITVVGTAPDVYVARHMIIEHEPDVLTLDLEMPRMGGLTFLEKLMRHHPMPVIVVSSFTPKGSELALSALRLGAVDVMCKPDSRYGIQDLSLELIERIKEIKLHGFNHRHLQASQNHTQETDPVHSLKCVNPNAIIAIGASTGGTQALEEILAHFPVNAPPTVVVQHMSERFTELFAKRLNEVCQVDVKEAQDGDVLRNGLVLIAPGNKHMQLKGGPGHYNVSILDGPLVRHHRPSVDVLFRSVAKVAGQNAIGVILTGMGDDGAEAMLELKRNGARTIAQNEETCVVFGMPGSAVKLGAAQHVVSLYDIHNKIWSLLA